MKIDSRQVLLTVALGLALAGCSGVPNSASHDGGPSADAIDPQIAEVIAQTKAIDNHAHPILAPPDLDKDRDFDALPVDNMEPESVTPALRPDYPPLADAWRALFGFDGTPPLDANSLAALNQARSHVREQQGSNYSNWVLDQSGIETMLANRVAMGTGVQPPRFRWVPYADALLFPLDNSSLAQQSPDRKLFFADENGVRARYLKALGLSAVPATLADYLSQVVSPTLEHERSAGAVAEKFEMAYLRSFDVSNPSEQDAARIYAKWATHGTPPDADYKTLQDFIFRYIAVESGRLGMAVHLHTFGGDGSYFQMAGVNPMLLEPLLNDPRLRKTNFVLIHGGWPYVREMGALLLKPNVYTDLSAQSLTFPPHMMAQWLREWLEYQPEKVLYGTDAYPYSPTMGWEESAWLANRSARAALGVALTGMLRDHEITLDRAKQIAILVLHDNAKNLYHF